MLTTIKGISSAPYFPSTRIGSTISPSKPIFKLNDNEQSSYSEHISSVTHRQDIQQPNLPSRLVPSVSLVKGSKALRMSGKALDMPDKSPRPGNFTTRPSLIRTS